MVDLRPAPITSTNLEIALREAIRDHAERHQRGQLDLAAILEALGGVAANYLLEIGPCRQRDDAFIAFCLLIGTQLNLERVGSALTERPHRPH